MVVAGDSDVSPEVAVAQRLGITSGMTVAEIGFDDDCDALLRDAVELLADSQIVDEDFDDVIDVVMIWFREGDDDLVDLLVDSIAQLDEHGVIWLFTPKPGRDGHVEPEDIADAAPTAGLMATSSVSASQLWQGTRLVTPHSKKR
jgi:hypothetical protein